MAEVEVHVLERIRVAPAPGTLCPDLPIITFFDDVGWLFMDPVPPGRPGRRVLAARCLPAAHAHPLPPARRQPQPRLLLLLLLQRPRCARPRPRESTEDFNQLE